MKQNGAPKNEQHIHSRIVTIRQQFYPLTSFVYFGDVDCKYVWEKSDSSSTAQGSNDAGSFWTCKANDAEGTLSRSGDARFVMHIMPEAPDDA